MDFVSRISRIYFFEILCSIFRQRFSQRLFRYLSIRSNSIMASEPPKRKLFRNPTTRLPARVDEGIAAEPQDIVGMTKEEFEKQKMLFSSEFLLGLAAGCTTKVNNASSNIEAIFRPPPMKRDTGGAHQDVLLGKKSFAMPPKRVLFVKKPLIVSEPKVASAAEVISDKKEPIDPEKPLIEITNVFKRSPKKYTDFLPRTGLEPIELNPVIEHDGISYVKVSRHLLATYKRLELPGIYFYPDNEDYSYLAQPKLEPWDVDPAWYLKSSEFTAIPEVQLGSVHVHEEHVTDALLMYSSRRGISPKDRTYFQRHGPEGPGKYKVYRDFQRERKGRNKYPPSIYRGYVADYLQKRDSVEKQLDQRDDR